jgi:hypothetical protein
MRPHTSVRTTSIATTKRFRARTAGKNWIFGIQPATPLIVPVKSKNKSVTNAKTTVAIITLTMRNMGYNIYIRRLLPIGQIYIFIIEKPRNHSFIAPQCRQTPFLCIFAPHLPQ